MTGQRAPRFSELPSPKGENPEHCGAFPTLSFPVLVLTWAGIIWTLFIWKEKSEEVNAMPP